MPSFNDDHVITLLVNENPKNILTNGQPAKSRQRFALYKSGMTVAQYKAAVRSHPAGGKNYAAADLIWDAEHGFIKVAAPANVAAAPAVAATAAADAALAATPAKGKAKRSKKA